MLCIKARITLYNIRKVPFGNRFHPLFNFVSESKVGGLIVLLDRNEFQPAETAVVEIRFPIDSAEDPASRYLGDDFSVGTQFTFDEGTPVAIGEGVVEEILWL